MTEVHNLEALEQRAEKALEKAVTGWREFAETMREIKNSEAHKEAGYRYFQPYYRDLWAEKTQLTFSAVHRRLLGLRAIEEFEEAATQYGRTHLPTPNARSAEALRAAFPEAAERVDFWEAEVISERVDGAIGDGVLRQKIREHKTGVIEQLEGRGVEIPPYPEGPTDEEVAYKKFSELAAVAKDVTPEAAARAVSSSTAYSVALNYDFLLPWVRSFLAELHIRAGR